MSVPQHELDQRLQVALDGAVQAQELILKYYQNEDLVVEDKADESPVTVADRGAEELLREIIGKAFPDDGILGEEFPETPGKNGYRWILDPIDGTKSFVHGVPLFGTLIGIEYEKQALVGVCRFPALDEVVYAAKGSGAWWKKRDAEPVPARVSDCESLSGACLCTTNVARWIENGWEQAYSKLCSEVKLTRGWGDCFGHMLVATGRAEIMVDPILSPWDAAALLPIVEEAGGEYVDRDGVASIYTGSGISVVPALKQTILERLSSGKLQNAAN